VEAGDGEYEVLVGVTGVDFCCCPREEGGGEEM